MPARHYTRFKSPCAPSSKRPIFGDLEHRRLPTAFPPTHLSREIAKSCFARALTDGQKAFSGRSTFNFCRPRRLQKRRGAIFTAPMWKRLPRYNRAKDTQNVTVQAAAPDPRLDEKQQQQFQDVSDFQTAGQVPEQGGTGQARAQLPELPFRAMRSQDEAPKARVVSHAHTTSSVSQYSQPSPELPPSYQNPRQAPIPTIQHHDVSPPTSPSAYGYPQGGANRSGDVSPLDSEPRHYDARQKPVPRTASNIPVPRKGVSGDPAAFPRLRNLSGEEPTRWDDFTGNITRDSTGKTATVNQDSPLSAVKPNWPYGLPSNPRQYIEKSQDGAKATIKERATRMANPGLVIDTRPAWRGASGRHAIVASVADTPGQDLPVPRRSSRRIKSPESTPTNGYAGAAALSGPVDPETSAASVRQGPPISDETTTPIVPVTSEASTPSRTPSSPAKANAEETNDYPSPISPIREQEKVPTPVTASQQFPVQPPQEERPKEHESAEVAPAARKTIPRKSIDTGHARQTSRDHHNSRFSWTTYNTATTYQQSTYQESPPPSPPPPMPATFAAQAYATPTPVPRSRYDMDAVMSSRKRAMRSPTMPTDSSEGMSTPTSVISPYHKAFSPMSSPRDNTSRDSSPSGDTFKALPPPPAALTAANLIDSLQAQLDDLTRQRRNIQRVIHDFMATQPQNPLVSDFRSRKEAEKKLAMWRDELSAIEVIEHDVGLRLHRAWKRKECKEGAEPSALWIRRVAT